MFRIGRKYLLFNINSYLVFKSIYGIGSSTSSAICSQLGFSKECVLFYVDTYHNIFYSLRELFLKIELFLEMYLIRKNKISLRILKRLRAYRGIRYFKGFPIRGQRRHTNAKTIRMLISHK